jgi:hypothetical protein
MLLGRSRKIRWDWNWILFQNVLQFHLQFTKPVQSTHITSPFPAVSHLTLHVSTAVVKLASTRATLCSKFQNSCHNHYTIFGQCSQLLYQVPPIAISTAKQVHTEAYAPIALLHARCYHGLVQCPENSWQLRHPRALINLPDVNPLFLALQKHVYP